MESRGIIGRFHSLIPPEKTCRESEGEPSSPPPKPQPLAPDTWRLPFTRLGADAGQRSAALDLRQRALASQSSMTQLPSLSRGKEATSRNGGMEAKPHAQSPDKRERRKIYHPLIGGQGSRRPEVRQSQGWMVARPQESPLRRGSYSMGGTAGMTWRPARCPARQPTDGSSATTRIGRRGIEKVAGRLGRGAAHKNSEYPRAARTGSRGPRRKDASKAPPTVAFRGSPSSAVPH